MELAPPEFYLSETDHVYHLGDRILPGTTEILRANGVIDSTWFNEVAMQRGRAVHFACQLLAEGDLAWESLDKSLLGYVEAYHKAIQELDFMPYECEVIKYHPIYFYGTKPDQIGLFGSKNGIIELKTGTMQPWTALQTAFQAFAIWPTDFFSKIRIGLELHANGTFRTETYENESNYATAVALYEVWKWKVENQKGDKRNGN